MAKAVKEVRTQGGRRKGKARLTVESNNLLDKAKGYEVVWPNVAELFKVSAARIENQSFVYAIGEEGDGAMKIGLAKDPIKRLRSMQTGNPRRLKIEHVLVGDRNVEKLLHEIWEGYAIFSNAKRGKFDVAPGTEWFEPHIRAELSPVLETAANAQIDLLLKPAVFRWDEEKQETIHACPVTYESMEDMVRLAHTEHGIPLKRREPVRLLAQGAGYVDISRRSYV